MYSRLRNLILKIELLLTSAIIIIYFSANLSGCLKKKTSKLHIKDIYKCCNMKESTYAETFISDFDMQSDEIKYKSEKI